LNRAEKHIKNAWLAGIISAALTFVSSLIGAYSEEFRYTSGFDTGGLMDVAIILALTYGIYKKNRYSALALTIYFVAGKISMFAQTGSFLEGLGALLFGYFFFMGTVSTFQLRKHAVETGQIVQKKRGWVAYATIVGVSLIVLAVVYFLIITGSSPETWVVPGKQLNSKYFSAIGELGLIDNGEEILYWYSDALVDFMEGFYFFTDNKVVIYSQVFENPAIIVYYPEILDIVFSPNPSFFEDSQITLYLRDGSTVFFPVSSEKGGDEKFYNLLLKTWQSGR